MSDCLTCASLHVGFLVLGDLFELLSVFFLFLLELFERALEDAATFVQRVHDFLAVVLSDGVDGAKNEDLPFEIGRERVRQTVGRSHLAVGRECAEIGRGDARRQFDVGFLADGLAKSGAETLFSLLVGEDAVGDGRGGEWPSVGQRRKIDAFEVHRWVSESRDGSGKATSVDVLTAELNDDAEEEGEGDGEDEERAANVREVSLMRVRK